MRPADAKWDKRFLRLAREYSTWSKDPSTRIGAIAVDPDTKVILSHGYNGFPRQLQDNPDLLHNRLSKYPRTVHAEMNVVCNSSITGTPLVGATLYCYGLPMCVHCCPIIIQAGIRKVVECYTEIPERWEEQTRMSRQLLKEAGISTYSYTPEEIDRTS